MLFPGKNLALQVAEVTMGRQGQSRYPGVVNAPQRRSPVSRVKKYSQRGADFSWESVDTFMNPQSRTRVSSPCRCTRQGWAAKEVGEEGRH
ncbi:hypothetical protein BCF11_4275 [Collimonas sp. PA-H2]|nr:hypothetical protein BCF11_4275 [Collimonas sp. PA-H2]